MRNELLFDPDLHLLCMKDSAKKDFINACESIALRFCSPVYLVGSSIWNMYPNDIDVYISVDGQTYINLFTNYGRASESEDDHKRNHLDMKIQQAKIYKKQKDFLMERVKNWDFDVKFEINKQFLQHKGDRVRLDLSYTSVW